MREIKFRAWDKKEERMTDVLGVIDFSSMFNQSEDENLILMQYTNLKDKNGKEIYEGDVVKMQSGYLYVVEYYEGSFWVNPIKGPKDLINYYLFNFVHQAEIIGNIYENPELIK